LPGADDDDNIGLIQPSDHLVEKLALERFDWHNSAAAAPRILQLKTCQVEQCSPFLL